MPTHRRPIDPEPVSVKTMATWSSFTDQLQAWELRQLKERAIQFIEDQTTAYRRLGQKLKRDLKQASNDELGEELILAALKVGAIRAYASFPPSIQCYKIEPYFWDLVVSHPEAIDAIREGICPDELMKFSDQTLERDLANRPLFIDKSNLKQFLKLRPTSAAQLRREAKEIIAAHKRRRSSLPMIKNDFTDELIRRRPDCTKHRAEEIWSMEVPAAWRRPGRRQQP